MTRPAGSLGAGGQARARPRARRKPGSDGDWEPCGGERAFKERTGERALGWRARAGRLELAARSGKGGRSKGRGSRASARPSLSSFPERLGPPLPPPPPSRSFPPEAARDWLRGSDVRVSMTYRAWGAAGEEGAARARGAVTPSVTAAVSARGRAALTAVDAGERGSAAG